MLPALPVDGGADELHVEADRPRDLADSEVTADGVVAVGLRENRVALEGDLGVLFGIEEVGRTKMAVTLEIAGRDALDLDGDLEVALFGVPWVERNAAAVLAEAAANGAHHHVLDRKAHCGMRWVDIPEHLFFFLSPGPPGW